MSLSLTVDLVADSGVSIQIQGITLTATATRVATVANLDDGTSTSAATALDRAVAFVRQKYPYGQRYGPNTPGAVVMGWKGMGMSESDTVAKVQIVYGTPTVQGGSIFVVSDSTRTQSDTTQIYRNDRTGKITQLVVTYQGKTEAAVNNGGPNGGQPIVLKPPFKQYTATTRFDKTLRTVRLEIILPKANLPKFRPLVNHVNDDTFNGLPTGFWKFDGFDTTTEDLGVTYRCQISLNADVDRDWSSYNGLRDHNTGLIITVDPAELKKLQAPAYSEGVSHCNGAIRVGNYVASSFSEVFGNLST